MLLTPSVVRVDAVAASCGVLRIGFVSAAPCYSFWLCVASGAMRHSACTDYLKFNADNIIIIIIIMLPNQAIASTLTTCYFFKC
jgi:hypothetical protein